MPFKRLLSSPTASRCLGRLAGSYVRFVFNTARIDVEPEDAFDLARRAHPAIFAFWHGLAMMAPAAKPIDLPTEVMIAKNHAAGIIAIGAETQGIATIRASGAADPQSAPRKGGAAGFRRALRALAQGRSVLMTADVPKVAQTAGRGVVLLARHSGRPIVPVAYVSRSALRFNNWDRMSVDLPFSRAAIVHGRPIRVAADADAAEIEAQRHALSLELDRVTRRAFERAGRLAFFRPGESGNG